MQDVDSGFLEVLDTYMDMVEKQEEIIYRLSKIVQRQAYEIAHMKNICGFTDEKRRKKLRKLNWHKKLWQNTKNLKIWIKEPAALYAGKRSGNRSFFDEKRCGS